MTTYYQCVICKRIRTAFQLVTDNRVGVHCKRCKR